MSELTPEERKKIYLEEKERLKVQNELKSKKTAQGCLTTFCVLVLIIWVLYLIGKNIPDTHQQATNTAPEVVIPESSRQKVKDFVGTLIAQDIVKKISNDNHDVYVDLFMWNAANVDQKEMIANMLMLNAAYSKNKENDWIDIYDYQSGKKLASNSSWGLKIH